MLALNRIVSFAKVHGAEKGLAELKALASKTDLSKSGLFYAIKAELLWELKHKDYNSTLKKAIQFTKNKLVKRHLQKKLT